MALHPSVQAFQILGWHPRCLPCPSSTTKLKDFLPHTNQTSQTKQTQAGAALPSTSWHCSEELLAPFICPKGTVPGLPSPLHQLKNLSMQFQAPVPLLSVQRARGLNPSSTKENTTSGNGDLPAVAGFLSIICNKKRKHTLRSSWRLLLKTILSVLVTLPV